LSWCDLGNCRSRKTRSALEFARILTEEAALLYLGPNLRVLTSSGGALVAPEISRAIAMILISALRFTYFVS
jgi:hypothetical protein